MTRRSRLLFWLALGLALLALHWFLSENADYLADARLDSGRVLTVIRFLAAIPLIIFAVRLVDLLAFDVFASRRRRVHAPMLLRELVQVILYAVLLAWAVSEIFQKNVTAVLATGTVVAAILGLALQETLGNLFSGIALHLDETFAPGDVIRSGDTIGVVEAVRWRGTRLRTFNNNLVVVPNSMLARDRLEVFPRTNLNARIVQFQIDYHVPPAKVIDILVQAASNVEGVAHEIPAFARVGGYGDGALVYEIKYHMHDYSQRDRIDADIRKAVWYALQRNGISLPFPVRALQRYVAPETRRQPEPEEIMADLGRVDVLSPLPAEARQEIARAARVREFSRGETIITHDAAGDSMFVVHDGTVSVRVDDAEVATLKGGDFFGEMALLTGERRAADVIATSDVTVVEIARHALAPVLQNHPDLAAAITAKVMERRGSLDDARRVEEEEEHESVLSRIRAYFRL